MRKRSNLQFLVSLPVLLIFSLFLSSFVFAAELNEALVFKKIAVLDVDDHTGKGYGEGMGKVVRNELEQMLRFDIVPPEEVRIQYPLSTKTLGKISKDLKLDAFIAGRVTLSDQIVTISLEVRDGKGEMFAQEFLAVKELEFQAGLEKNLHELVWKLIHRIPYKAVITKVENGMVTFDAGRIHGVAVGSKASLFEIVGVKRHPFTNEAISFVKEDLGEIQVMEVEALSAKGKIVSLKAGAQVFVHQKVDFIPSQEVIRKSVPEKKELLAQRILALKLLKAEKLRRAEETPTRSRGSLIVGSGFVLNDLRFSSNELEFKRRTSPVPVVTVVGEYLFLSSLGADLSYTTSWIQFDKIDSTSIKVRASPHWTSAHLKYRYFFARDPLSPEIAISAGYGVYDFMVNKRDPVFFNDIRYSGIEIAVSAVYPISSKVRGILSMGYQPALHVKETPVTSGTESNAYAYSIDLTGQFKIIERLMLALGYHYQDYRAVFSGVGTRNPPAGTTDSKLHDFYHGAQLSLIYEF